MRDDINLRIADEGRPDLVSFRVLNDGQVMDHRGISVTAMRNQHPPLVDTFALSFRNDNTHVVFSGDTAYLPALAEFAQDADLLIHETMLKEALPALFAGIGNTDDRLYRHWMQSHTLAQDVAKIATAADVGALALELLNPSDDPAYGEEHWVRAVREHWSGRLYVGTDGLKIRVRS